MMKQKKDSWKKHLPKSKREQNAIFKKVIFHSSSAWEQYVHSEDKAFMYLEYSISIMERKKIDVAVGLAVILNLADEKLGVNEGVGHLKSALKKIFE